jgi:hypothetical protein
MLFEAPRLESGIRTRDRQLIRLLLYHLSYIQKREGIDDRRHTVLQRSRTSEGLQTSAIGDHDDLPPAIVSPEALSGARFLTEI